ncbi:hypothetical protein L1049_016466 [Liquidambar formosana]|uniref:Uncharacterized protein n=1 Tax=Liquidambar formosana TaxID=63359 RepID=A0AAP0RZA7_LIQFO
MVSCSSESESIVFSWNSSCILEGPETLGSAEKKSPEPKTLEMTDCKTNPEAKIVEFADSKANPEAETLESVESTTNPEDKILEFADSTTGPEAKTLECVCEKDPEAETLVCGFKQEDPWPKMKSKKTTKKKNQVLLEGYVEAADEDDLTRTKSLTDEDLDELKGCLDLGFGFSYEEIPELCNTLPALELCYSMSQKFLDEQQKSPETPPSAAAAAETDTCSSASGPIANWRISSPGDHPEDVKARLKFWAQAVACTVRLCS